MERIALKVATSKHRNIVAFRVVYTLCVNSTTHVYIIANDDSHPMIDFFGCSYPTVEHALLSTIGLELVKLIKLTSTAFAIGVPVPSSLSALPILPSFYKENKYGF